jgi:DNA mismatch repair protein MutS2
MNDVQEFLRASDKLDFKVILERIEEKSSSELGKQRIRSIQPFRNVDALSSELNLVSEFKGVLEGDSSFFMDGLHDVRNTLHKAGIENLVLTSTEILRVNSTLQASRRIKSYFQKNGERYPLLSSTTSSLLENKILEFNISQAIDENGLIRDSASKELQFIRKNIVSMYETLRDRLEKTLKGIAEKGITQDEIVTTRDGRMVIPVKVEFKSKVPGFIHSSSASGSTVFIEPAETLSLNNEIRELHFREQREIERILRILSLQIAEVRLDFLKSIDILSHLDLLYAKARYSIGIKGNTPRIKEKGSLKIINAKHPILIMRHGTEKVVPLSLDLGEKFTTLLITGPNAGGKSVAMKTAGLLALMVQCGLHIPASPDSEFPIFQNIFVDIGDNQSIENDLSTFGSHILRIKELMDSADERSFVLIDEIGAGTDPAEGGALACSVLKNLTKSGALTIATTHQVSLKAFAYENSGMENAAMEFDLENLLPTYTLRIGVPGSSYALEIAKRLGISSTVLEQAAKFLGEQKTSLEKLLIEFESRSQILKNELEIINSDRLKYKDLVDTYNTKLNDFNKEMNRLKAEALAEAREIARKANSVLEECVREIRNHGADRESIKEAKKLIRDLEAEIKGIEGSISSEAQEDLTSHIAKGDLVRLKDGSQVGEVLSIPDSNNMISLAFKSIKLKVKANEIQLIKENKGVTHSSFINDINIAPDTKIDVRGLYADEAVNVVDKFLDSAVLSGLMHVEIVHGKGAGVLRKRISNFLSSDKRIKSFRTGEWNEGGTGATFVELRE